jgi:hypothetical protein
MIRTVTRRSCAPRAARTPRETKCAPVLEVELVLDTSRSDEDSRPPDREKIAGTKCRRSFIAKGDRHFQTELSPRQHRILQAHRRSRERAISLADMLG